MSFKLRLLYQLNLHHIIAPSYFLMQNSGTSTCEEEMDAHRLNGTWEIVKLPDSKKSTGSR
jgi:hypothetical protein